MVKPLGQSLRRNYNRIELGHRTANSSVSQIGRYDDRLRRLRLRIDVGRRVPHAQPKTALPRLRKLAHRRIAQATADRIVRRRDSRADRILPLAKPRTLALFDPLLVL